MSSRPPADIVEALRPYTSWVRTWLWRPIPLGIAGALLLVGLIVMLAVNAHNLDVNSRVLAELDRAESTIDDRQSDIDGFRSRLAATQSELAKYKGDASAVERRSQELDQTKAALDQRSAELDAREAQISGAEAEAAKNEFGNGVHVVGSTVNPGTYSTGGPSGSSEYCYYAFKSGTGSGADIVDNNLIQGPGVVTLEPGDVFESSTCQKWTRNS